jgi:hypothetical protein
LVVISIEQSTFQLHREGGGLITRHRKVLLLRRGGCLMLHLANAASELARGQQEAGTEGRDRNLAWPPRETVEPEIEVLL